MAYSEVYLPTGEKGDELRKIDFTVKYSDVYSLQNLYVMMSQLMAEEGWNGWDSDFEAQRGAAQTNSDIEILYSENNYQRAIHMGGKELWVWWRFKKHHQGRRSDYFINTLDIDFHPAKLQPIEVVHQGKKAKAVRAEIEIFFTARIIGDRGLHWKKSKLMRNFKHIYNERMMHTQIEKREKELWRDVYRIQSKIKTYFNLRQWQPAAPDFHSKLYGWEGDF